MNNQATVNNVVQNAMTTAGRTDAEDHYSIMKGKRIVVIGEGTFRLRNIWLDAKSYGVKICLVEANPTQNARKYVDQFIQYDFSDHKSDIIHASEIVKIIQGLGIKVDGCVSFWDECVSLAALVNEKLGTRGPRYEATMTANSKTRTQNVLSMHTADVPLIHRTATYSSASFHLETLKDCDNLPERFPAILKLDNGAGGVGACVVRNREEIRKQFCHVTSTLRTDSDFPGIGLSHGNSMTTMEFYSGTEHIVDVIIYDQKLIAAFITDSGFARQPYFIATARRMPSFLPKEQQEVLINAAYRCCIGIGLSDGTFNVEFMMTEIGPKLLEINARMGGYCLRDWLQKLYGVDIMLYSMMVASGITPCVPKLSISTVLIGVMVIPSLHAKILKEEHFRSLLFQMIDRGDIFFLQFRKLCDDSSQYEKPFGNIAVSGATSKEAKRKLKNVCRILDIDQDNYEVEKFIQHF